MRSVVGPLLSVVSVLALAATGLTAVPAAAAVDETGIEVSTKGLTVAQVDSLNKAMATAWRHLPGGVTAGVWVPGVGRWVGAIGEANRRTGESMRAGLQIPVGSVTKTLTGTLVLQQVQAGRLSLDDRLSKWFPRIAKSRKITVAMLLNMTSGIADFVNGNFTWLTKAQRKDPRRIWTPGRMIRGAMRMPRAFAVPGSQFAYSNTNTIILGRILEKVRGVAYEELLQRRILDPLGMSRSFIDMSGDLWDPHAQTYSNLYGEIHGSPRTLRVTNWSLSTGWAAGGLASTLWDMKVWAKALGTGEGVLQGRTQRRRTSDCVVQGTGADYTQEYCLGMAIYREISSGEVVMKWHNGTMLGATSYVAYFPRTRARLVVQANQDAQTGEAGLTIPDEFFLQVFQEVPELLGL